MNKIVISGYYGFDNLGDEAILAGIISLLKKKNKELKITVLSASPEQSAQRYGVEAVSRTSIPKILALLKEADLFISGGGSLLQDITGSGSVPYYLGLFWLAKLQNCKTAFYAQGVGPLNKKRSRLLTAFSLNRFDFIGVRDKASQQLLKDIGLKKDIKLTVDPVFALYKRENVVRQKIKGELKIGVSVRPWPTSYLNELAKGLNGFAQKYKVGYQLFPMHKGSDEKTSQELKELLDADGEIIDLAAEPEAALKEFSLLDLFLGVRLHSLIFALINQIPSLALSYDPKIEGLIDPIDYLPLLKLEGLKAEEVEQKLEQLLSERYTVRKKLWDFALKKKAKAEEFLELLFEEVSL
ncbi:polysaccharide pyruvyl transferase CsaB [Halanaerobium hydrogeniformans]|uniref:Polysaccharide pyruvyl transferase CsaB n=1 Tax=Halanaerobium hydrogeniformans TaxID=656519 RepID=E4RPR3_HALHG|nr:polysaccharide pyruvyl transferase CsaB [Halanaerobium hydrogeniformans]ADQ13947.1 polysaccharide pyruvyl transferase CsaB [Halanaerobium hydrogeniformans]